MERMSISPGTLHPVIHVARVKKFDGGARSLRPLAGVGSGFAADRWCRPAGSTTGLGPNMNSNLKGSQSLPSLQDAARKGDSSGGVAPRWRGSTTGYSSFKPLA